MLRRIEGWTAALPGRMDWDAAARLGRKALGWTALAGTMFLLSRATAAGRATAEGRATATGLAPLAMAFMAAALLTGHSAAALLAGCLAGAVNGTIQDFNLRLPVGAAVVLGGSIAWDFAEPALRRWAGERAREPRGMIGRRLAARQPDPRRQARSPNGQAVLAAALAGAGTLLPGLAGMGEAVWPDAVTAVAASVASVAAAPFMARAMEAAPDPRRMDPEARIGLFLLAGGAAAGLARLSAGAALWLGGALAMLLHPSGALAGIGLGCAMAVTAGDGRLLAMAAVGGAAAQLCGGVSRHARAMASCGAMLAAGLYLNAPVALLAGGGLAALAVIPMPHRYEEMFAALARPVLPRDDPRRVASGLRRASAGRLHALAEAFGELAEGYMAPVALPDEQALLCDLRERLCGGCGDYGRCWAGERNAGARFLCDLIARAVAAPEDAPLFEEEATPDVLRRCRRGRLLAERVQEPLEDFARARREELRRGSQNRLVSAQFLQAQRLLEGLARRQARGERPARPRYRAETGAVCAPREAGVPSGDSHVLCMLDGRRLLALICDGMGSGDAAARESAMAVRLLGRFLRAGADCGLAIETVNALLLNRGGDDMFATVDMLVLDLTTGEAEFTKQAACATLIARRGELLRVEGGRLPLGILEQVRPGRCRARLEPGDVLLMASDGVMDAAGEGELEALLLAADGDMPALARRALALAEAGGGEHMDDRTAIAIGIGVRS